MSDSKRPRVKLLVKGIPEGAVFVPRPAKVETFECRSITELALRIGRYRREHGDVLQFDDPITQHIGFCSEDHKVEWRLPVQIFFGHFESRPMLIKAFAKRREYIMELGEALTAVV